MKTSSNFRKLFGQVAGTTADGASLSRLLSLTKSSSLAKSIPSSKSVSPGESREVRPVLLGATGVAKGINFGSPSSDRTTSSPGTSEWANLLKQTASGGISSQLGGGVLNAIGGVGGLVSSLVGLFGGGMKTEAPLTRFQLPDSQSENVFATANASRPQAGARAGGPYRSSSDSPTQVDHGQLSPAQSAQITQAVKQALLNSSSLNDVIAEI